MAPRGRFGRRSIAAVLAIATSVALAFGASALATASTEGDVDSHASHATSSAARELREGMRRLWVDHVTWTRLFIVSFVAELPDLSATTERLLQNQTDIGDAVKPFYGQEAGNELTELLNEHILTAADVLAAAKSGDTAAFEAANAAWYENAREIARFLHEANSRNWKLRDLRSMMREHLDLTLQEASAQLSGEYAASVALYDEVETEILHMADMLSDGIIAQFPRAFA
jgi:hypothetical protein